MFYYFLIETRARTNFHRYEWIKIGGLERGAFEKHNEFKRNVRRMKKREKTWKFEWWRSEEGLMVSQDGRHYFGWINFVLNTCQLVNNTEEIIIIIILIHLFGQFYDNNIPIVTKFFENINYTAFPCSIAHLTSKTVFVHWNVCLAVFKY